MKCKNCLKRKCKCDVCTDLRYRIILYHGNKDGFACILCHNCGCTNPEPEKK